MPQILKSFEDRKRTPKGHFVVYVGDRLRRFVVPLSYLRFPTFSQLMENAAEEFGYCSNRRLVLPCDEATFCKVLESLSSSN